MFRCGASLAIRLSPLRAGVASTSRDSVSTRPRLKISTAAAQRLGQSPRAGWIYKSEVENPQELDGLPPVLCNVVVNGADQPSLPDSPTAVALVDPKKTVVYGRIIDLDPYCVFDQRFTIHLLERALQRREMFFANDSAGNSISCRLFHGESDGIPGLYIDKFVGSPCPVIVMRLSNVGLEGSLLSFIKAVEKVHCAEPSTALFVYSEAGGGKQQAYSELVRPAGLSDVTFDGPHDSPSGEASDNTIVIINENGVLMAVDIKDNPGYLLNRRSDRSTLQRLASTMAPSGSSLSILDLYSYSGSYAIQLLQSLHHSKSKVVCVDKDAEALRLGQLSCEENGIRKGVVQFVHSSVEQHLQELPDSARYNVIVVDPPSIADKAERKSKNAKLHSIETVVAKAVPHLASRGLLHITNGDNVGVSPSQLAGAVARGVAAARRPRATIVHRGTSDYRDHPGYSVYEGFMVVSVLGYALLTLACIIGMHLSYKQAMLCDTDKIIRVFGHVPPSWKSFIRPSPRNLNYLFLMIAASTAVPVKIAVVTSLHVLAIIICLIPSEKLLSTAVPVCANLILRVLGLTVRQHGERLSPRKVPTVAVNHVSYLDIYVLESCGATPLSFVAKKDVRDMFLIGQLARAFDCVFVSRSKCPKEREEVVGKIRDKQERVMSGSTQFQLCIFPEGTTTNGTSLMKFRKGAFESLLPVQPVKLAYASDHCSYTCLDLLCHVLIFLALACIEDMHSDVYWLPEVCPSDTAASTGEDLADATRLSIARATEPRSWPSSGVMATALLKDFLREETSVPRKGPYTAEEDAAIVEYVTRKVAEYMRERKRSSRRRLSLKGDKFWKLAAVELRAGGSPSPGR
ncbi:Lysophosphatidylcholine acyltransferase 2 [Perkinsus olseni]|uniref:Lysophosphatidylcholine acyltransferase 2 n=1 Tax=Perkinsus olseni TaxID=32597 RepID=A0A7J6M3N9_PEROL|nr:Lysophosphatidylcholine acyltransferase 2 [Perkinsus olseni]